MKEKQIKILAIETSCDETAAAVIAVAPTKLRIGRKYEITNRPVILSNIVSSQVDLHAKTGGIVPEVASRAHMESIIPVIEEALNEANLKFKVQNSKLNLNSKLKILNSLEDITHIAVTAGPGLIGSLLVGFNTAKAMAYALNVPIIPINHIEGHIYSAFSGEISKSKFQNPNKLQITNLKLNKANQASKANEASMEFPILALTVSGGHTSLTLVQDHGKYLTIGQTRDDAAGEAFDKVAKLLNLGYPGGPEVSKLAEKFRVSQTSNLKPQINNLKTEELKDSRTNKQFNNTTIQQSSSLRLPRPMINDRSFDFSFSGLKTAVLEVVRNHSSSESESREALNNSRQPACRQGRARIITNDIKAEICAAFEDAVVDVLCAKTLRAAEKYHPKTVLLAGGVAANKRLREELKNRLSPTKLRISRNYEITKITNNRGIKESSNINFLVPPINLCGDNAAMIGLAAYYHIVRGDTKSWNEIKIDSNLAL